MIQHQCNREGHLTEQKRSYERCEELARYLLAHRSTVRETAAQFGISKSTVHKDVTDRLVWVNPGLSQEVHELFELNKSERHLRGGEATRKKYIKNKSQASADFCELKD